ncbi:MAG: cupin domain-containing protein [Thermoanaerobaculales bacterium]
MSRSTAAVIRHVESVDPVVVPRCRGATLRVVLGPESGVPNFVTRHITLDPGGRIPCHRHDSIEHEQVILDGKMVISLDGRETEVGPGDAIFIPAGVDHWYENRSTKNVNFVCVVPNTADYQTEWLEEPAE